MSACPTKNPAAAGSHAVADACERKVAGFARFNLCDILIERARRDVRAEGP